MAGGALVLDTNVVLDLLVFAEPSVRGLRQGLRSGKWCWLSTVDMRAELERVLRYPRIVAQLAQRQLAAAQVLAEFDRQARRHPVAPVSALRCADPDDQKFLDLALAHEAVLLSRDRALLNLARRLQLMGVTALTAANFVP